MDLGKHPTTVHLNIHRNTLLAAFIPCSDLQGLSKAMVDPALQMTAERDCGHVLANMSLSCEEINHQHNMICKKVHT